MVFKKIVMGLSKSRKGWTRGAAGCLVLVLMTFVVSGKAWAQSEQSRQSAKSLVRAESYLSHGKYEEATIILEKLRLRDPANQKVVQLLRRAYQRNKEYAKLLDLLLADLPHSPKYEEDAALIADCHFKLGQVPAAESTLTELLVPPPADPQVYRLAARTYQRNGRHMQAVDTYERAREYLGQPTLFSRELADLYEARREYAKAIKEYFVDLQENPRNLRNVRRKIAAIVRVEEGTAELTAALQDIVAENPDNFYAHRLYAELLLESGDAEAAWPEYVAADRLAENPTEHILYFIRRCLENRQYDPARKACLTFFEQYSEHTSSVDVKLFYARALVGLGKPDSAITILQEVVTLFPRPEHQAETYQEIGNVYLDRQNNLDSAEHYYRQALASSSRHEIAFTSSVRLGDCLLRRGDLAGADSAYAGSAQLRPQQDQQEVVRFKRVELLFFTEKFDSLITALGSLIADYPQGFYVNDAIVLTMRVNENREPFDWSLKKFAAASLGQRQGRRDTAQVLFWELAADSTNGLADDALLELGRLYVRAGWPDSAVIAYGMLIERYPGGFLMPAALTEQGETYATKLNRPDSARAAYRRVLTEYADSPFLEEARRRLKDLSVP